jgi:hypothetical protein
MGKGFVPAVRSALTVKGLEYLVLGDCGHGLISLKSLAAAVKNGDLKPLHEYQVTTVLFEGARRGEEMTKDRGAFRNAVQILSSKDVQVFGCEDDASEATVSEVNRLMLNPGDSSTLGAPMGELMNRRMPDANESWTIQIKRCKPKVILCCGTSHLPTYNQQPHFHIGLIKQLSLEGLCLGYAVDRDADANGLYTPEKNTGYFGSVDAIDPHDKYEEI